MNSLTFSVSPSFRCLVFWPAIFTRDYRYKQQQNVNILLKADARGNFLGKRTKQYAVETVLKVLETITPWKRSETPAANVVCMYDYAEVVKLGTCGM